MEELDMQESGEMYLETILVLSQKEAPVRSLDIANHMGVSRPSVSRAMAILKNGKYIHIDDQGYISLADSGRKIAEKIYERHVVMSKFLIGLGVDKRIAEEDACRIEHIISDESFDKVKEYVKENEDRE